MNRSIQRVLLAAVFLVGVGGMVPACAQVIQQYTYRPNGIYEVRTGLGITTEIQLSPHEHILDYSTGFSSGWNLARRGNVFYLRPKNVDVDTNMLVRTETHSYIFELKVVATDWRTLKQVKNAGVEYKISFKYPVNTSFLKEAKRAAGVPALNTTLVPGRSYDFDYQYAMRSGTPEWMVPRNVYDDGHFTYIKLDDARQFPTGDFPAVYMREKEHGKDEVVNTTVKGNTIVVQGTYPYLVLRHGKYVVGLRRSTRK